MGALCYIIEKHCGVRTEKFRNSPVVRLVGSIAISEELLSLGTASRQAVILQRKVLISPDSGITLTKRETYYHAMRSDGQQNATRFQRRTHPDTHQIIK